MDKLRGKPTVLPEWWLTELLIAVDGFKKDLKKNGQRWSFRDLGLRLAELADRRLNGDLVPWDRKTIERFLKDKTPTEELLEAFRLLFPHLIKPTFVARNRIEALELAEAARRYKEMPEHHNEKVHRRSELQAKREEIEVRTRDQRGRVESTDVTRSRASGVSVGRRNRRMGGGGSAPS